MRIYKLSIILILLMLSAYTEAEEIRALWIPSWDLATKGSIDAIIDKAVEYDFNTLLVEVRYRCDTFYTPNRAFSEYPNPDSTSRLLQEDFDALQYVIDRAVKEDLEVHAWLTAMVATSNDLKKCNNNNPWFRAPDMITTDVDFVKMHYTEVEGAYLDPGLPEVQDYIYNVVMDIAVNYQIDGIHLDYIRYPGRLWGYHKRAFARYQQEVAEKTPDNWHKWRQKQLNNLVRRIKNGLHSRVPAIELTAAVYADPDKALNKYDQDWLLWLRKGYVKRVFPMNYSANLEQYKEIANTIANYGYQHRTVMGIRAWQANGDYEAADINKRINYSWEKGIYSYALFSSTGLNAENYWQDLIMRKTR